MRTVFGFCDTVLLKEDPNYEYIAVANQDRYRFRNQIIYNSNSMRSQEIDPKSSIILGFGDSVLNGGVVTDHSDLATTILSDSLTNISGGKTQFLNISAGSWGPDNCFAYLHKHGDLNSKAIYLFVSSHDAYDNMTFDKVVGVEKYFPNKQYGSAIYEVIDRYLIPKMYSSFKNKKADTEKNIGINKQKPKSEFNSGFANFVNYSITNDISFTIYLHAELSELKAGAYNKQGQRIVDFANTNHIPIIKALDYGFNKQDYRDHIHLSESGQEKIAQIILKHIDSNL